MKQLKFRNACLGLVGAALAALLLVACGGGSTGSTAPPAAGIGASLNIGTITGFGSVVVNGVRYDYSSALIAFDDNEDAVGNENKGMQLGMDAAVKGSVDSDRIKGMAKEIHVESKVRGPAKNIMPAATGSGGTLEVMGVKIIADDMTYFHNQLKVSDLRTDDIVNVHGTLNADGSLQARFLQKRLMTNKYKTIGTVTMHDMTKKQFMIGTLTVTYNDMTQLSHLPNGISDGLKLRVTGWAADYDSATNTIKASKIKGDKPFEEHDMNEGEIRGMVADLSADKLSFTVNGMKVMVDANTQYKNGSAALLANGVIVEVEGKVTNGEMTASEVKFYKPEDMYMELYGTVSELTPTTTPVGYSFMVHGVKVQTDDKTLFKFKTATMLANGMNVEVKGSGMVNGVLLATKVSEESM